MNSAILLRTVLLLVGSFMVGCASLRNTHQLLPVACNSPTCDVTVNEVEKVVAPGFVDIERDRRVSLKFEYEGQKQEQNLDGRLRWKDSILANAILGVIAWPLGAVGVAIDYFSGNIWEIPNPEVARFKGKWQSPAVDHIVIVPVQAETQLDSEEAAAFVLEALRAKFPQAKVQVPEEFSREFRLQEWGHDEIPKDDWRKARVYSSFGTPYVAFAKVHSKNGDARNVSIEVRDVLRDEVIVSADKQYKTSYAEGRSQVWMKSKLLELVPDSASVSYQSTVVGGMGTPAEDQTLNSATSSTYESYFVSSSESAFDDQSGWGVSVSNMGKEVGSEFAFVFKWATEASFRRSKLYVRKHQSNLQWSPSSSDFQITSSEGVKAEVEQYFLGGSIGPEIGVAGSLGYMYLHMLYGVEVLYANFSNTSEDLAELYSPLKVGLGYRINFGKSLEVGIEAGYRLFPEWLANKILGKAAEREITGNYNYEMRTTLTLTYRFSDMKSFGQRQMRDLYGNP